MYDIQTSYIKTVKCDAVLLCYEVNIAHEDLTRNVM